MEVLERTSLVPSRALASLLTCPPVAPGFCTCAEIHLASIPLPTLGKALGPRFLNLVSRQPEAVRSSDEAGHFLFFLSCVTLTVLFSCTRPSQFPEDQASHFPEGPQRSDRVRLGSFSTGDKEVRLLIPWTFPPGPVRELFQEQLLYQSLGGVDCPESLLSLFSKMCLATAHELCNPSSSPPSAQHVLKDTKVTKHMQGWL